ncbi:MAG: ATP-binding cassette domain-containing protein [Clostridia bacterium]|nr:ATP-binding cassette domain-containing protein [Clostridia bacterium]
MENIIEINKLDKKYGKSDLALDSFSITVKKGDIYGFVGENGAGKTTLIRILTGMAFPTAYEKAEMFGIDLRTSAATELIRISALIESPALYRNLNAYSNMLVRCKLLGYGKERIKAILDRLNLPTSDKDGKKARSYSLGMKQRLAIALALLPEADLYLLDEPINALDPEGILLVRNIISELRLNGKTILISSHILGELSKIATCYGFIHRGKMLEQIDANTINSKLLKNTAFSLSGTQAVIDSMRNAGITNCELRGNDLVFYGNLSLSSVIHVLDNIGVEVYGVNTSSPDLESYYFDLVRKNAGGAM